MLIFWKNQTTKNYFTSSDPHHGVLGGGCQVWVVIENMIGRTLISGFLGLVILVRWSLITMFLSWTTQTGCRIHRTYVSLIGSGKGRHTTHLLKCVLLLSTSQTDWKQSSDVLSDISFDILSDISSDISSDILSDISFDILSDISSDILSDIFLTYLLTCFLTYLLTSFLTYQNQTLTSTASQKKSSSANSILTSHHAEKVISMTTLCLSNVIALSASDRPAKRQLSPKIKMQNACSSTHTHTPHASDRPAKKQLSPRDAILAVAPHLHLMACANHEPRPLPLWLFPLFCVGGSARHIICFPLMHSNLPKGRQGSKDWSTLLQLLLALRIWNSHPFIRHIPQDSLHNLWHNEHTIASTRSAKLHANADALSTNKSQSVAPHMPNSFGKPIGCPNEDRRRTFHHKLRHGCQTKLTCLHTKSWASSICCSAPHQMTMPSKRFRWCKHEFLLSRSMYVQIYMLHISLLNLLIWNYIKPTTHFFQMYEFSNSYQTPWTKPDISFDILSVISSGIASDILWDIIFWHSFCHIFCHSFWHLSDISSDMSSDTLSDISSHIIFDISFGILSDMSSHILSDISFDILSDISSDILYDISFDILSDISFWHLSDISFDILSDISSDISFWHFFWHIFWHFSDISSDILSDISFDILSVKSSGISSDILWDISFDILSGISSDILSDISFDILSDISSDILSDISFAILSDIFSQTFFLNFFQTYLLTFFLTYRSDMLSDRGWGPARHTDLTESRLRSGTPHWTHRIAVEVRHATLNSQDRGWGPARRTELKGSRLRSGTPHWTHRIVVEVRHATLNSQDRGWGPARHTELTVSRLRSGTPAHHIELTWTQQRDKEVEEEKEEEEKDEDEEVQCWHKI